MAPSTPPSRVLLIRPSALGDVARSVCALASLHKAWPQARIDWLVRDDFAPVVAHHPALHRVIPFARRRLGVWWRNPRVAAELWGWLAHLKDQGYQAVYDLQALGRSGLFTWATRAPHRVGPADARELAGLAYTRKIAIDPSVVHTVDRMLAVLAGDGIQPVADMRLYCGQQDRQWAEQCLARLGLDDRPYAVIAPTTRWLCKCWPARRFARLAEHLPAFDIDAALVVGGPSERRQVADLFQSAEGLALHDLVGQTTVGQLMALIERAQVVLSNDSAAAHLAVGFGRRLVCLFGPTDPARVGPYRYPLAVVQPDQGPVPRYRAAPDDQSLISRITVEQAARCLHRVMTSPPAPVT